MTKVNNRKPRKERLSIFYVNPMSYNNLSIYDYSLLSNLDNCHVEYFCSKKYDYKMFNANFNKIYTYSSKTGVSKLLSYLWSQIRLLKKIRNHKVDTVHFQWFKVPYIDYLILKLISNKVNIVFTAHNLLPHDSGENYKKIFRKIYGTVDSIIVHSEKTKIELISKFEVSESKVNVIPHGILNLSGEVDHQKIDQSYLKFKSDFKLQDKVIFSVLGSISDYKGIDLIIGAWKRQNLRRNQTVKLLIAGKGDATDLKELEKIDNCVIMNRFLSQEEFLACLKLSDFVLLPYKKISQSGVLLTAISEKKRVIVSDVGGLSEPFKIGNIGYVLEKLTVEELNRVIVKASLEKHKLPDDKIWNEIYQYYDWSNIARLTEKNYLKKTGQKT
ncbi:glycosyltransferase [Pseudozobellia sp. WGM2]|uniref:glycosyltransferase n=1 Tax=Pseudozobellia sp. WGM2 TaxID=2787625 RepID=UPI001ADEDD04|nr:glycosyltransferase [Pseudozobellia sp. WGM2]